MASSDFSKSFTMVSPAAHRERRDGCCEGVHFPIYPNIYYSLNCPGAFNKGLSLNLLVLPTKIPVACVGVLTNLGLALKISLVPSHGFVAGQLGDCLRAYQLPMIWGVPSLATPPRRSRGRLAPRAHFPRVPVPTTLPTRPLVLQVPLHAGPPVPTSLSRPLLGPWPTAAD